MTHGTLYNSTLYYRLPWMTAGVVNQESWRLAEGRQCIRDYFGQRNHNSKTKLKDDNTLQISRSNRGPVALCTLGLGLLNPPSLNGR